MLKYFVVDRKNPITKDVKYYAQLASPEPLDFETIAQSITGKCTVTRHDVLAVLSAVQEEIVKALQMGQSVRLGDLGSFRVTLHSRGAVSEAEFQTSNITSVNCRFSVNPRIRAGLRVTNPNIKFQRLNVITAPSTPQGPILGE